MKLVFLLVFITISFSVSLSDSLKDSVNNSDSLRSLSLSELTDARVVCDTINIYKNLDPKSPVIGKQYKGDTVSIHYIGQSWDQIFYKQTIGWVSKECLEMKTDSDKESDDLK